MALVKGTRYEWWINKDDSEKKDGLFTGEYDKHNGNALLLTRNGEEWSIPIGNLTLKKIKDKGRE